MARTALTKTTALGGYQAALTTLTMNAADIADLNSFVASGNDFLIVHNTNVAEQTITITSVADPFGRSGTITTEAIAADGYRVFGPMSLLGWEQTDGSVYLQASAVDVLLGVITLP